LFSLVKKKIRDEKLLNLVEKIIGSSWDKIENEDLFTARKTGIPIGNLTSQLFANVYLNELDQFVKRPKKQPGDPVQRSAAGSAWRLTGGSAFPPQKYYLRYMDDFLFLGADKKELRAIKEEVGNFLRVRLKLELHPKKANIFPVKNGIDFLGYRVFSPGPVKLRKRTVYRFLKRMKKYRKSGKAAAEIDQSVQSFLGFAKHADAFRLVRKMCLGDEWL